MRVILPYLLATFAGILTLLHFASIALAWKRCRLPLQPFQCPKDAPPVSIVRPICGLNAFEAETLGSGFCLDYPQYELIFCVADCNDAVVPLVRDLIAAHPRIDARLIVGDVKFSANPKLNNVVKGWEGARHDWIILADSNVLMPRDYIQRLMARWGVTTGLVCSVPIGAQPEGFWAALECAFLNGFQARWQYAGERLGFGFAQGKTMLWRRDVLENGGGIRALASDIAEDAASTKLVHAQGLRVQLVEGPFDQPLGQRSFVQVWRRQLRWARLRRVTFPLFFVPEILAGALWPVLAAGLAADLSGRNGFGMALGVAGLWFTAEALLARAAGWHLSWSLLPAMLFRDALLPALWLAGWLGSSFEWRGHAMSVRQAQEGE